MATHSSTLAWKIPWTEERNRLQSMGSQRVGHDWATSLSLKQLYSNKNNLKIIIFWKNKTPKLVHRKNKKKVKVKLLSCVRLFETPWTVAYNAPLSMGFSRQEYWSGVPFPSPPQNKNICQLLVLPCTSFMTKTLKILNLQDLLLSSFMK